MLAIFNGHLVKMGDLGSLIAKFYGKYINFVVSTVLATDLAVLFAIPDSKVHGANMGPTCGRQDPGGPHVDPMNFVVWDAICRQSDENIWVPYIQSGSII